MTDREEALELLNATHDFPTPVMFKIIGRNEAEFTARVLAAVRETLQFEADPPCRTRETTAGRHVSITIEPVVNTAESVLAVYARLREVEGVVMVM